MCVALSASRAALRSAGNNRGAGPGSATAGRMEVVLGLTVRFLDHN